MRFTATIVCFLICTAGTVLGDEAKELTLENVAPPAANNPDEPNVESFSLEAATRFLDQSSLNWTKKRNCFTCHTNYMYLVARPAISFDVQAHQEIRASLESLVEKRWAQRGPRWDAEVVMSAAVLAINDEATTGKLHATTRKALDRMWTVQRKDGGVDWLKCGWPPMESDDEFGASMMALAVGAAPEAYRKTEAAQAGLARLRDYFAKNAAPTLHHRAMMLWADSYLGDLLSQEDRQATIRQLLDLQNGDGGWVLPTLGDWKRSDGKEHDLAQSDGYGTGFVIYVLRRAGIEADHPQLKKGIAWLKANQRASGRWYTRSLNQDGPHYLSHAGSAFAVLAIAACEESPAKDKADAKAAAKTISLFNGKDLTGWHVDVPHLDNNPDADPTFIVRKGLLVSLGRPAGHLITDATYENYRLEVEYRFAARPGNCGVLVHASTPRALYKMFPKSIEVQMNSGHAGDFWCIVEDITVPDMIKRRGPKEKWGITEGKARRILNLTDDSEKKPGEWNHMVIECVKDEVKVWVNGDLVNHGSKCTAAKGSIALQAEGSEVEFRKLELTPISKLTD